MNSSSLISWGDMEGNGELMLIFFARRSFSLRPPHSSWMVLCRVSVSHCVLAPRLAPLYLIRPSATTTAMTTTTLKNNDGLISYATVRKSNNSSSFYDLSRRRRDATRVNPPIKADRNASPSSSSSVQPKSVSRANAALQGTVMS